MNHFEIQHQSHRVAVLIDGDNISPRNLAEIVSYTSGYGELTIRKVFGDWTRPSLAGWKSASAEYGFRLEQATAYTAGKNTADLAIVMEAMDIRYQHLADTICIASSDGDFTGIAQRLREAGIRVLGFGAAKTPESLVTSCSSFLCAGNAHPAPCSAATYGEEGISHACQFQDVQKPGNLTRTELEPLKRDSDDVPSPFCVQPAQSDPIQRDRNLFTNLFLMASGGRSTVTASAVSLTINRKYKDFRLKDYGCKSTAKLYEALGFTVMKENGKKIIKMPAEVIAHSKH